MSLVDYLLPGLCVVCAEPPANLCDQCARDLLHPHPVWRGQQFEGLALADFNSTSASVLRAIKERGQTALIQPLIRAASGHLANFAAGLAAQQRASEDAIEFARDATSKLYLVPVPSTPHGMRKRGFVPAQLWARHIARTLESAGYGSIKVVHALEFGKNVADQRGLTFDERHENLRGSMILRASALQLEGRALLIDDVVTTGATIAEAARALGASSLECVGFLTFAETLLKTDISKPKWV